MASIVKELNGGVQYRDRRFEGSDADYAHALATSTTVYVGNLAFNTREEQIYELFGMVGPVKEVIMGLNHVTRQPCGFAFVIYYSHKAAQSAASYITGTRLDNRFIRVDIDWGFEPGRQFGRGKTGGQVRDEFRDDFDPGRGGHPMNQVYLDGMGQAPPHRGEKRRLGSFPYSQNYPPAQRRRESGGYSGSHRLPPGLQPQGELVGRRVEAGDGPFGGGHAEGAAGFEGGASEGGVHDRSHPPLGTGEGLPAPPAQLPGDGGPAEGRRVPHAPPPPPPPEIQVDPELEQLPEQQPQQLPAAVEAEEGSGDDRESGSMEQVDS